MKQSSNQNSEDFSFILNEIANLDHEEFFEQKFPAVLAMLSHPVGYGQIPVGLPAYRKLQSVALRAVQNSKYNGHIDHNKVFSHLEKLFSTRFLKEQREVTTSEADKTVSAALKMVISDCQDTIYYFPCHIDFKEFPVGFDIGPVTFRPTSILIGLLTEKFNEHEKKKAGRGFITKDETIEHFNSYSWTAKVQIDDCDSVTSEKIAYRTVLAAMNSLHATIGASQTEHFLLGNSKFQTDIRSVISENTHGELELSKSIDWLSNHFPDDWWEQTKGLNSPEYFEIIGRAIYAYRDNIDPAPLAKRYIDAIAWYGEAARDQFLASKIIKFITAIERITITKNTAEITKMFATRSAALSRIICDQPYDEFNKQFTKAYDLRSDIVHGSLSPEDPKLAEGAKMIEQLATGVMQGVIIFYGWKIDQNSISKSKLEKGFENLIRDMS